MNLIPICECRHRRAFHPEDGPCIECPVGFQCIQYWAASIRISMKVIA